MKQIYLFLLAGLIGFELCAGAISAPVIFKGGAELGLSHFQSGVLMSQIFVKFNYLLLSISVFSLVYEGFGLRQGISYAKISQIALSFIVLIGACFFVFYCTSYIMQAQKMGEAATQTPDFASVHSASELIFKLIILAQTLLFFLGIKAPKKA